jgi:hypothetical protein
MRAVSASSQAEPQLQAEAGVHQEQAQDAGAKVGVLRGVS